MNRLLALDFPPITHLTVWRDLGGGINKTVLIYFLAAILTMGLFLIAGSKKRLQPSGLIQNTAESSLDFVKNQIILPTMGVEGMPYLPLLATMFFFIFFSNITEIIPGIQFPANARFAMPLALTLMVWVVYIFVGFKRQGLHYLTGVLFPPGVPKPLYILVTPIEFVSTFFVRPLSLSVRLFANMLAGHLILVTFAVLSAALWAAKPSLIILPFPFLLLVGMTGFEILVGFLQAFIFTILTAVYIASSQHAEH
jgi:F-type H+-transporting ATPase subunit a